MSNLLLAACFSGLVLATAGVFFLAIAEVTNAIERAFGPEVEFDEEDLPKF
jgi:hypothetical protein